MEDIIIEISKDLIISRMHDLETILRYQFNNIDLLAKAMCSKKLKKLYNSKNHREYYNEKLAMVGDSILSTVIVDNLYRQNIATKSEISRKKEKLVNNELLHDFLFEYCIINFAYNQWHFFDDKNIYAGEQVVCKTHDAYVEAIIGAIYYDAGYDKTKEWILSYLLPRLYKIIKQKKGKLVIYKK